jgi:hypothetical protein
MDLYKASEEKPQTEPRVAASDNRACGPERRALGHNATRLSDEEMKVSWSMS